MRIMNSYGVTEVISLVTVTMIATTAIGVIVFWGIPTMESQKVFVRIESALTQFKNLNKVIQRVSTDGMNKSERVDFVTDAGQVNINNGNRFVFYYSTIDNFGFNVSDLGDSDDSKFTININDSGGWINSGTLSIYYLYNNKRENHSVDAGVVDIPISSLATNEFKNAVKMELRDRTEKVFGRIWLFDTGSISYDLATTTGNYNIIAENEGVVSIQQGSGYMYQKPSIHNNSYSFVMRITRLQSVGAVGGAGMSKYEFLIKSNDSSVQENKVEIPQLFRTKIYGDEKTVDAWTEYFKSEFGFSGTNGDLSFSKRMNFTLVYSLCDVLLR